MSFVKETLRGDPRIVECWLAGVGRVPGLSRPTRCPGRAGRNAEGEGPLLRAVGLFGEFGEYVGCVVVSAVCQAF